MKNMTACAFAVVLFTCTQAQTSKPLPMRQLIAENFALAQKQYSLLFNTPTDSMPRSYGNGRSINSNLVWWTSGFYPASLLYIYEYTKDTAILQEAQKRLASLEAEKTNTIDHDLGFKMYCSFGNAYRLTKNDHYKEVVLTAAQSLASRYRPAIRSIQSWNKGGQFECPVIIDNMMNLEMLEWASRHGGTADLDSIAVNHANTTLQNHFRSNYSSFHVLDYDLATGQIIKKVTAQGANDTSAWSRGQAWALYGFTMMYRCTNNPGYLAQAKGIAHFIMNHPNLPADKIPYWDFDAPNIPHALRDASAAAIFASALLELGLYCTSKEKQDYTGMATTILHTLSTDTYRARPGENGGFLLKHSVGALPYHSEVDVPLTYADYYFLEAMLKYQKWYLK